LVISRHQEHSAITLARQLYFGRGNIMQSEGKETEPRARPRWLLFLIIGGVIVIILALVCAGILGAVIYNYYYYEREIDRLSTQANPAAAHSAPAHAT
jgi:hypothetical protein